MVEVMRFTMCALYAIEASALKVTVTSLVTGAVMAAYDVMGKVAARDAFFKVPDDVRDCALRARWLCQARETRRATQAEINAYLQGGPSRWEAEYDTAWPGGSYFEVLKTQVRVITDEIDTAIRAQAAQCAGKVDNVSASTLKGGQS